MTEFRPKGPHIRSSEDEIDTIKVYGAWSLGISFLALALLAIVVGNWGLTDFISLALGIIVALGQLLLVYVWIDRKIKSMREEEWKKNWEQALKEFLALCSMSARDLSRGLAYHIEQPQSDSRATEVLVLREGVEEMLDDISAKANSFDVTARLCSGAFDDKHLAELAKISVNLRTCALNANSASKRLKQIGDDFVRYHDLSDAQIKKRTCRLGEHHALDDPLDKARYGLVRDIDEIIEPMVFACERMMSFVKEYDLAKIDTPSFVETSTLYQRAIKKYDKRKSKIEELKRIQDNLDNFIVQSDFRDQQNFSAHLSLLKHSLAQLAKYADQLEANGLCVAWVPEDYPEPEIEEIEYARRT